MQFNKFVKNFRLFDWCSNVAQASCTALFKRMQYQCLPPPFPQLTSEQTFTIIQTKFADLHCQIYKLHLNCSKRLVRTQWHWLIIALNKKIQEIEYKMQLYLTLWFSFHVWWKKSTIKRRNYSQGEMDEA